MSPLKILISSNRMETVSLSKFISTYFKSHTLSTMTAHVWMNVWISAIMSNENPQAGCKIRWWEEQIPLVGWIVGELQDSEVNHKEKQRTIWIRSECEGWSWTVSSGHLKKVPTSMKPSGYPWGPFSVFGSTLYIICFPLGKGSKKKVWYEGIWWRIFTPVICP